MKHEPIEVPKLERINTDLGRMYVTPSGTKLPSVTTILSHAPNESLQEWKKSVGEEEAKKIATRAAMRGTYIHAMCESVLKGTEAPPRNILHQEMWTSFRPLVEQIEKTYAIETPLYSVYLAAAGTVDCVGVWNNRTSIIDFKTSSSVKKAEDISSYFMQCAAYSYMWYERTGMVASQLVIMMAIEDEKPLVFVDDVKKWLPKFIQLSKEYHSLNLQLS